MCVRAILLLLYSFYNPVGVVMLSFLVWARCIPCGRSLDFVLSRYSLLPKSLFVTVFYYNDVVLSSWI